MIAIMARYRPRLCPISLTVVFLIPDFAIALSLLPLPFYLLNIHDLVIKHHFSTVPLFTVIIRSAIAVRA